MAIAQRPTEPAAEPLSTTPNQCWTSGSGASYFKVCVSRHGNVVTLQSPSGKEHIAVGNIVEGYIACAKLSTGGSVLKYYDAGVAESGWAEPYKVTSTPSAVYRKTTDGKLELVQKLTRDAAEFDFTIAMTLYNRSGNTLYGVYLDRYADFDINNTWGGDQFHRSPRGVFGWDGTAQNLVSLTSLSTLNAATAIHGSGGGWGMDTCNKPSATSPTAAGDWIARISYNFGTMAAGTSKTVKLLYRAQ